MTKELIEAVTKARESARMAELDIRQANRAAIYDSSASGQLCALLLEREIGLTTLIARHLHELETVLLHRAIEEPATVQEVPITASGPFPPFSFDPIDKEPEAGIFGIKVEEVEPPPAPLLPGHCCSFIESSPRERRCNVWLYPEGHPRYHSTHTHTFTCGKPIAGTTDTCDENEGHTGPCASIPF